MNDMSHLYLRQVQVLRGVFVATKQFPNFRGDCFAPFGRSQ